MLPFTFKRSHALVSFRAKKCFLFRLQRCNARNRRIQWTGTRCTPRMHTIRSCRTSASTDTRWSAQRPDVAGQIENGPERHLPARRLIVVHLVSCTTVGSRISRRVSRMMGQLRKLFINKQCEENWKNIFFCRWNGTRIYRGIFFNLTSILQTFRLKIYIYIFIFHSALIYSCSRNLYLFVLIILSLFQTRTSLNRISYKFLLLLFHILIFINHQKEKE